MPTRYVKDDVVYFYNRDGEWVEVGPVGEFTIETEMRLMEDKFTDLLNATKKYENHWYLRVPFTKKRLIFAGLRYQGWYTFK